MGHLPFLQVDLQVLLLSHNFPHLDHLLGHHHAYHLGLIIPVPQHMDGDHHHSQLSSLSLVYLPQDLINKYGQGQTGMKTELPPTDHPMKNTKAIEIAVEQENMTQLVIVKKEPHTSLQGMKVIEEVWSQDTKKIVATLISILMMGGVREIVTGNTQGVQNICPEEESQRVTLHLTEHQEVLMIGMKGIEEV